MYPDHSPEAAMQSADLKSYSKLNEEFGSAEDDDDDGASSSSVSGFILLLYDRLSIQTIPSKVFPLFHRCDKGRVHRVVELRLRFFSLISKRGGCARAVGALRLSMHASTFEWAANE